MKKYYPLVLSSILALCMGVNSHAQIGVNTNKPTANLDVNGTLRVRSLEKGANGFLTTGKVKYIMGVDESGNVIPIEVGENVKLENNRLIAEMPIMNPEVNELPNGGNLSDNYSSSKDGLINDLDLGIVILPGGGRTRWPVFRLTNGNDSKKVEITGLKSAYDGAQVWLYPTSGEIKLKKSDKKSKDENQILSNKDVTVKKFEMIQLMYDNSVKKWIIMSAPSKGDDD